MGKIENMDNIDNKKSFVLTTEKIKEISEWLKKDKSIVIEIKKENDTIKLIKDMSTVNIDQVKEPYTV